MQAGHTAHPASSSRCLLTCHEVLLLQDLVYFTGSLDVRKILFLLFQTWPRVRNMWMPKSVLSVLRFSIYYYYFWPYHMAYTSLVSQPGIEPITPAVKVQNLNHWNTRESHASLFYKQTYL